MDDRQVKKVVLGPIGSPETIAALHDANPSSGWFNAGFPCQSWSRLGDKRGLGDHRGTTMCQVLKAAWMLQPLIVILECVPEAGRDSEVQKVIKEWLQAAGMRKSEAFLHLQRTWPAKRTRWYCMVRSPH